MDGFTCRAHLYGICLVGNGPASRRGGNLQQAAPERLHERQLLLPPLPLQQRGEVGRVGLCQLGCRTQEIQAQASGLLPPRARAWRRHSTSGPRS
jgi:hypothetical protein